MNFHWMNESKKLSAKELMLWTVVLGKTLESPLDCEEIQPVHSKGNQSWICIRRTNAEAEAPILWPPDAKYWLIGKDPDAGKDRRQEEKGMTEDEMVGWHHWLNGLVLEQLRELVKDREAWCAVVHVVAKSQTWTTYKWLGGLSHCLMNNDVRAFINTIYFPILLEQAFISLLLTDQSVKQFSNALACFF